MSWMCSTEDNHCKSGCTLNGDLIFEELLPLQWNIKNHGEICGVESRFDVRHKHQVYLKAWIVSLNQFFFLEFYTNTRLKEKERRQKRQLDGDKKGALVGWECKVRQIVKWLSPVEMRVRVFLIGMSGSTLPLLYRFSRFIHLDSNKGCPFS